MSFYLLIVELEHNAAKRLTVFGDVKEYVRHDALKESYEHIGIGNQLLYSTPTAVDVNLLVKVGAKAMNSKDKGYMCY